MKMLQALRGSEQKKENDHPDKEASAKYGESDENSCKHLRTRFLPVHQNPIWSVAIGVLRTLIRIQVGMPFYFYDPFAS
jgi:hypothetical protein